MKYVQCSSTSLSLFAEPVISLLEKIAETTATPHIPVSFRRDMLFRSMPPMATAGSFDTLVMAFRPSAPRALVFDLVGVQNTAPHPL
jgi:hypothetical protein